MRAPISILHMDEHYLVVDKPAGLPTHATVDATRENLLTLLEAQLGERLGLHHRLDRDTTGVLVLARTDEGNRALARAFAGRDLTKTYLAVVEGVPTEPTGRWKDYVKVAKHRGQEKLLRVPKGGDVAILDYQLVRELPGKRALVSFTLLTGRRHQIRAQAAMRGLPLVGDPLYGRAEEGTRCLLHSWKLSFGGPTFEAPLPPDFSAALAARPKRAVVFNKPMNVLSQFSGEVKDETLAAFGLPAGVYAAGRLDKDSEGLLILSDDGAFIHRLATPEFEKQKTYWVQVEKVPQEEDLARMRRGLAIQGERTLPCQVQLIQSGPEKLPPRNPPIRERKNIPTAWLEIVLTEGRNRQVRRMTAAIGHPTLRLVRVGVGKLKLLELGLAPGEFKWVGQDEIV